MKKEKRQELKHSDKSRIALQKEKEREKKKKKRKIQYVKILFFFIFLLIIALVGWLLFQVPIQSIIVKDNEFFRDQEIIDMALIRDYPSTLKTPSYLIRKNIEKNIYIQSAKVEKKNWFTKVVITVDENRPLFYYETTGKTVLESGEEVEDTFAVPTLLNQVPSDVLENFIQEMGGVPLDILSRMSEIRYTPDEEDTQLFLISMNDGNYVYATLETENGKSKFQRIYNYIEYLEGSNEKKGVLHLEGGEYLDPYEKEKKK